MRPGFFILAFNLISIVSAKGQNFQIAYNIYDSTGKDYEVYLMNADGSGKRNLSNKKAVDWTYHANGQMIYFISDRDTCTRCFFLYEIKPDGSSLRRISDLQLEDSWMDNNNSIMVVSARQKTTIRFQLAIINLQSGQYKWITTDTAAYFSDPVFIEDGKRIAFRHRKNRNNRNEKAEIWVMQTDGSNLRQLSHYPATDTTAKWHSYHAGPPRWNPKHQFISYQSLQSGEYQLFAITPDGKKQWQLTNGIQKAGWHDWSKDGNWLVADITDSNNRFYDIGILRYGDSSFKLLTSRKDWNTNMSPAIVESTLK
jgi:TolB protein